MQAWVERRNALASNVASCDVQIRRIDVVIETGSGSSEVTRYVEELSGQIQTVDVSASKSALSEGVEHGRG